jgi:signal transduction histidine kinase
LIRSHEGRGLIVGRLRQLLGSISFRLALVYTLIFALSVSALFYFVYWTTSGFTSRQVETAIRADVAGFQESYQRGGMAALAMAVNRRSNSEVKENGVYLLIDTVGNTIAGNLRYWPTKVATDDLWINFEMKYLTGTTEETADIRALQFAVPDGFNLLVGRDIRDAQQFRRRLLDSFTTALALTVVIGLVGGLVFGNTVTRRLAAIVRTCRTIMQGDLSKRVTVGRTSDEIGELSIQINAMLDQIERLMKGMQQVSDNVAHDLRTPLNRLRSRLEAALRRTNPDTGAAANASGDREAIEGALADVDGLLATFGALLRIARAETAIQRTFTDLDLAAIGEDVAEMYAPLAEEKNVSFTAQFTPGIGARGDRNMIAQALANLVDNAIKYVPERGAVSLSLALIDGKPTFSVADTGPGVPEAFKGKVLERLFRLEQSRTSPGSGLGLSLVNAVARSHGIVLKLLDNHPGLRVTLAFPDVVAVPIAVRPQGDPELAPEPAEDPVRAAAE